MPAPDAAQRRSDAQDGAKLAEARRQLRAPRKFGATTTDVTRTKKAAVLPREKKEAAKDNRPHCNKRPDRTKGGGGGSKGFRPWC